ncbi:10184_t:CDS:2 [Gigaspora margarita]|uniref:10184_t:CDS:1 n=1 Tax=Gigaspora margarita TaxID=4874 RepID=A0ABN7WUK9_GIGMA|nr:10184_t:CDS:2 [Gigaspora margarita]
MSLGIHVSDFLIETIGPLRDDLKEAHEMMVLELHHNGFWNAKKLIIQVKQAINIFERTHPGCVDLFAFDNTTAHTAFAKDTFLPSKMNLFPSGSVPKMQDTVWNRNHQLMPKGLKWILGKRGLWQEGIVLKCASCKKEPNSNITNCCARCLMANQSDFLAQCDQVQ